MILSNEAKDVSHFSLSIGGVFGGGPVVEQFLTFYYRGRIEANSGDYIEAMLSYTKAEELIPYISDDYSLGLLYAHIGAIYEKLYDHPKA